MFCKQHKRLGSICFMRLTPCQKICSQKIVVVFLLMLLESLTSFPLTPCCKNVTFLTASRTRGYSVKSVITVRAASLHSGQFMKGQQHVSADMSIYRVLKIIHPTQKLQHFHAWKIIIKLFRKISNTPFNSRKME